MWFLIHKYTQCFRTILFEVTRVTGDKNWYVGEEKTRAGWCCWQQQQRTQGGIWRGGGGASHCRVSSPLDPRANVFSSGSIVYYIIYNCSLLLDGRQCVSCIGLYSHTLLNTQSSAWSCKSFIATSSQVHSNVQHKKSLTRHTRME
jgi:hypothetical protein